MKAVFKVINSNNLPDDKVYQEILLAETRMNDHSLLRFHLIGVIEDSQVIEDALYNYKRGHISMTDVLSIITNLKSNTNES